VLHSVSLPTGSGNVYEDISGASTFAVYVTIFTNSLFGV